MNKAAFIKTGLLIALSVCLPFLLFAARPISGRVITLAGLVVNAQSLSPVESAKILDDKGHILGITDKNGYYKITINDETIGEIHFKLKIVKQGFENFVQSEHWGNLGDTQNVMYFGLKALHSGSKSFDSFADDTKRVSDLSYDSVISHFDKVKKERSFESKLESAKAGNENVLVQIDGKFYIVDSNGWIAINSGKDLVSIDNKQTVAADKLNSLVKRKNVKGMTPIDSKDAKFLIHTK